MNKAQIIEYLLLFFFWFCYLVIPAQDRPATKSASGENCVNQDYQFYINGELYRNGMKNLKLCPNNDELEIVVYDMNQTPPQPLNNQTCEWYINNTLDSRSQVPSILLMNTDIVDLNSIKCKWLTYSVEIAVKIDPSILRINRDASAKFFFDKNTIEEFKNEYNGSEELGTPWVYLKSGSSELVEAKFLDRNIPRVDIRANASNIVLDPELLSMKKTAINITNNSSGTNQYELLGCDNSKPDLMIFTSDADNIDIQFYELCDTDDDVQVIPKGTQGLNYDDICIVSGIDVYIDLSPNVIDALSSGKDVLDWRSLAGYYVEVILAGSNGICDARAHPRGEPQCVDPADYNDLVQKANNTLKKAGVEIVSYSSEKLQKNWDRFFEDKVLDADELERLKTEKVLSSSPLDPNKVYAYLWHDLGGTGVGGVDVLGRADEAERGNNFLSYRWPQNGNEHITFPHEIAHCRWGLGHPDKKVSKTDTRNLMHSKSGEVENPPLLRPFQWHIIHE